MKILLFIGNCTNYTIICLIGVGLNPKYQLFENTIIWEPYWLASSLIFLNSRILLSLKSLNFSTKIL